MLCSIAAILATNRGAWSPPDVLPNDYLRVDRLLDDEFGVLARLWNPVTSVIIWLERCFVGEVIHGVGVSEGDFAVEAIFPAELLAGVGRHPSHDRGHGAVGTVVTFIGDFALSDRSEEIDVLLRVALLVRGCIQITLLSRS